MCLNSLKQTNLYLTLFCSHQSFMLSCHHTQLSHCLVLSTPRLFNIMKITIVLRGTYYYTTRKTTSCFKYQRFRLDFHSLVASLNKLINILRVWFLALQKNCLASSAKRIDNNSCTTQFRFHPPAISFTYALFLTLSFSPIFQQRICLYLDSLVWDNLFLLLNCNFVCINTKSA